MSDVETLLVRLDRVRQTGPETWMTRCPAHEDRTPSLSIRALPDGRILVNCLAGCSFDSVVSAVGMEPYQLMPPRPRDTPDGPGGYPPLRQPSPVAHLSELLRHDALVVSIAIDRMIALEALEDAHDLSTEDLAVASDAAHRILETLGGVWGLMGRQHGHP
jgi:hypothetical protein